MPTENSMTLEPFCLVGVANGSGKVRLGWVCMRSPHNEPKLEPDPFLKLVRLYEPVLMAGQGDQP